MTSIGPVGISTKDGADKSDQAIAMAFMLMHGKPPAIAAYADYHSQADVDWAESQIRDWFGRVDELNPDTSAP